MNTLTERLESRRTAYTKRLDMFKEKLELNPVYAFEWSQEVFYAAAWIQETTRVIESLENGATIEQMIDTFRRNVMNGATAHETSTLVTSNLMKTFLLSVRAQILEMLEAEQEVSA